jgi:hypothetical protein
MPDSAPNGGAAASIPVEIRPLSDPSPLTTSQIQREVRSVREILEQQINGNDRVVATRINGMDKAIELVQKRTDEIPTLVKEQVGQLQALHEGMFKAVETQFRERDTRVEQTKIDGNKAIDAALQAAKEAVGKTEIGFTKQIDAQQVVINTMAEGFDGKIGDIKDLISKLESRMQTAEGIRQNTTDVVKTGRDNSSALFGYIIGAAATIGMIITLLIKTHI